MTNKSAITGKNNQVFQGIKNSTITVNINGKEKTIDKHLGNIPTYPELFIGRDNEVQAIHQRLVSNQNILLLVNGRGGIGKTTLASKYYYEYKDYYQHLVWVFSGTSIVDALLTLKIPLAIDFPKGNTNEQNLTILLKTMAELNKPCLLIIDNANELADLQKYHGALLQCSNFHVLLTTRVNKKIHNTTFYEVKPLSLEAALILFKKHYEAHDSTEDDLFFDLFEKVNRNTLVVELLAKNLSNFNDELETEYTLNNLLLDINNNLLQLSKSEEVGTFYQSKETGVLRTETPENIITAMYDLGKLSNIEKRLLSNFAVLPAESIPYATLKDLISQNQFNKYLKGLFHKGWLDFDANNKTFRMSPVVQEVIRLKSEYNSQHFIEFALNIGKKLSYVPGSNYILNTDYESVLVHSRYAEAIIFNTSKKNITSPIIGMLCELVGNYHQTKGNLNQALFFYRLMLEIFEQMYNIYQNDKYLSGISIAYNKIGLALQDLGQYKEALSFYNKDKVICEALLKRNIGDEEPYKDALAVTLEKIGDINLIMGNLESAKSNFEKMYLIRSYLKSKYLSEKNDYYYGIANNKLGEVCLILGEFKKSIEYNRVDKNIIQQLLKKEPNNIDYKLSISSCYEKIGTAYLKMEKFEIALEYFRRYNKMINQLDTEKFNNLFKIHLATSLQLIATCFFKLNEVKNAIDYQNKSISLCKKLVLSSNDNIKYKLNFIISLHGMAHLMVTCNEISKAKILLENVERMCKDLIPYSDNLRIKIKLPEVYISLGYLSEEESNFKEAIKYYEASKKLLLELIGDFPNYFELNSNLKIVEESLIRVTLFDKML